MKLWLIKAREDLPKRTNPWEPWYDKAFGFVIAAETEEIARQLAADNAGDEHGQSWLSEIYSTCVELTSNRPSGLVLKDFSSG